VTEVLPQPDGSSVIVPAPGRGGITVIRQSWPARHYEGKITPEVPELS
jgi:hypothetical protein